MHQIPTLHGIRTRAMHGDGGGETRRAGWSRFLAWSFLLVLGVLLLHSGLRRSFLEWQVTTLTTSGRAMVRGTPADPEGLRQLQERVKRILPRCQRATVGINGVGSGVIVSRQGWILTAAHVLVPEGSPDRPRPGARVRIRFHNGRTSTGRIHHASAHRDIALVRFQPESRSGLAAVPPGDLPGTSEWCLALGHPGGFDINRGSVLRLGRLVRDNPLRMQSDCILLGGDSGGPLFDLEGRVVGIHSKISEGLNNNFHVPVMSYVRRWNGIPFEDSFPIEVSRLMMDGTPPDIGEARL